MNTREINVGNVKIGGQNPVVIQGMLKGPLEDKGGLISESREMIRAGAEIIRCAVPQSSYAKSIYETLKSLDVPIVADCHFQTDLALQAIKAGFEKVRLNPGNMSKDGIKDAVAIAGENGTALRFGFNSGSCIARTGLELAQLAIELDSWVKKQGFENFLISMKSSSVKETVEANRFFSVNSDTPLHIGITATGPEYEGIVKSSAGLGSLLIDGIGDTVRVSLTGSSLDEVKIGCILRNIASGSQERLELISCPTCSRKRIDVREILGRFIEQLDEGDFRRPFKVAIMGCEVNGPGEAKESDIGICGTKKGVLFFQKGEITNSVSLDDVVGCLKKELRRL